MLEYQVVLLEQDKVEFRVTTSLNPTTFLQASEEAQRPGLPGNIEQVYSGRPDLKSNPIQDPKLQLHTGESSRYQMKDGQLGTQWEPQAQALPF